MLIGDALFTKTQRKVLGLLYGKPGQRFFTNEIVRWADMGRGSVRRELERLTQVGVLNVVREGNQLYYQANDQCPVFLELKGLVRKTFGLHDVLAEALKPILNGLDLAFIYGSMAKGGEHQASDIDLMLVGDGLKGEALDSGLDYGEVMALLMPLEESLGRPINPTLYSVADFQTRLREGNSFLERLLEQPTLMIKGVIDDLR